MSTQSVSNNSSRRESLISEEYKQQHVLQNDEYIQTLSNISKLEDELQFYQYKYNQNEIELRKRKEHYAQLIREQNEKYLHRIEELKQTFIKNMKKLNEKYDEEAAEWKDKEEKKLNAIFEEQIDRTLNMYKLNLEKNIDIIRELDGFIKEKEQEIILLKQRIYQKELTVELRKRLDEEKGDQQIQYFKLEIPIITKEIKEIEMEWNTEATRMKLTYHSLCSALKQLQSKYHEIKMQCRHET